MKKILVVVCVVCLISLVYNAINKDDESELNNGYFTKEKWNEYPFERIYIVEDLNKRYLINAMNRNEILNLLGDLHCTIADTSLTYTLGKRREDILFSYFTVVFDNEDNVVKAYVYQD